MELSPDVQAKVIKHVKDHFAVMEDQSKEKRERLTRIYKAWATFTQPKESGWSSSFKINKAHEVVEKVLPKIIAKSPKWIVSIRNKASFPKKLQGKESESVAVIQDYLHYIWDEYNFGEAARAWAKGMVIYGKSYAKVGYKWEKSQVPYIDEDGEEGYIESVVGEYPCLEVKSWTDIYYDPRYVQLGDRPGFIEVTRKVRLADLYKFKDKYQNLDKLKGIGMLANENLSSGEFIKRVQAISGINEVDGSIKVDPNTLELKTFYGWFCPTEDVEDEKMYQITIVNDLIVIEFKEIAQIPFEEIKCFEDVETAFATGFVEPIISLQDEMNFKKNSASEYVNKALTRQVVWSSASGIDPRNINDPVILTTVDGPTALNNFVELQRPSIDPAYFSEQNDMERQIQAMTFTVDTSNPRNEQAMTNTATGIRVKFFENNSVIDEIRKRFEVGLQRLAYKLLVSTFENLEGNIAIKKMGTDGEWIVNKEMFRDVISRYSIRVETNSSSYDFIENRRVERLELYNSLVAAKAQGENVTTDQALIDLLETYESIDTQKYIPPPDIGGVLAKLLGPLQGQTGQPVPIEQAPAVTPPVERMQHIAGNI